MKNTSLMCLSSPEGDSNYYSALMELKKDDGTTFFNVVNCFQICERCMKLERVKMIECNHVPNTSHWLDQRKIRELKLLYKASPEDAIREFGGVVVSDYVPCFRKQEVVAAFKNDRVVTQSPPPYVFMACDPNGGGPSHMSIVSGYHNHVGDIVVSLALFFILPKQILLLGHQHKLIYNLLYVAFAAREVSRFFHALVNV